MVPRLLPFFVLHATWGCASDTPVKDETLDTGPGGTAEATCDPAEYLEGWGLGSEDGNEYCYQYFWMDEDCHDKVVGVRIQGNGATPPASVYVRPPVECGSPGYDIQMVTDMGSTWYAEAGEESTCPDVDVDAEDDLNCNEIAATGNWQVRIPLDALDGCGWAGGGFARFLLQSEHDCDPPADTPDNLCETANDAPAFFVHRNAFELDGDDQIHTHIVPVMKNNSNNYSERTWLREITVTDWGDATKLYVLKRGFGIHYNGDSVVSDSSVFVLSDTNTSDTYSEGEVTMGTTFATDSFDINDTSFKPPSVTFDWSCGVPSPAHFNVIGGLPQAYAIRLDDLGIQTVTAEHRVKLRLFVAKGFATLELEGRFHDAIHIPITASGANYVFDYDDDGSIGIDAAGTISSNGANKVVAFSRIILRGHDLGTPTWTLLPFSE